MQKIGGNSFESHKTDIIMLDSSIDNIKHYLATVVYFKGIASIDVPIFTTFTFNNKLYILFYHIDNEAEIAEIRENIDTDAIIVKDPIYISGKVLDDVHYHKYKVICDRYHIDPDNCVVNFING